ncbi:MAG: hypothetical protein IH610_15105 [Deltaproteobacteria bacterium]|nr:hypothetical protein [Deltaproteobacteria bacterium]
MNNETNLEVNRVTATGTPKSFSMDLPTGANYRFYVMENEGTASSRVYPMYMGNNNVFALDNNADGMVISLGMVSPDLVTGKATPGNHPGLMMGQGANAMIPSSLAGMAFSMDDVKGTTWGYNTVMTSGTMGWEHGTLSFDNNGSGHMAGIVRNGNPLSDRVDIPYTMSLSGMLLNPGDDTFQCVVSSDMTVMVGTYTDTTGGPAMMIAQKRGGVFHTDGSDMTGTWRFQRLTAGNDNVSSGWAYGTMEFLSGSATISMTTNNGTGATVVSSFTMDANGIMSRTGDASFHGVMSMDKNMIVATDTNGGNPEIWVMMKTTTATFLPTDMMGDWVMHSVSSGNAGSRDWTFGHSVVDANGNNTFSQMMGSGGPVDNTTQATFQMNGGVMTMAGTGGGMMGGGTGGGMMGGGLVAPTFHGTMNSAKNLMVSNYSDGSGGYPFSIQVK